MNELKEEPINNCFYKKKIIKLKTDSLDNEINKSKLIKEKLVNSKYNNNFSYILESELIELSQISSEISSCNLPKDPNYTYILCNYTNIPTNPITITDFLNKKAKEIDIKILIRIIIDFHVTLHEALEELYNQTKIVHQAIDANNIIISEEEIPIIQNFKEAKIMDPNEKIKDTNETSLSYDNYTLIQMFLNIIDNLNMEDEYNIMSTYKEALENMLTSNPNERSIKTIMNL
jgi:hypothetical protein